MSASPKPQVDDAFRPRLVLAEPARPEAPAYLDAAPPWGESSQRPAPTSPSPFIDDARDLADLAETSPPVSMLVDGLLMASCTWLLHGDWRSLKTWCVLELLIAGATGTPAFGLLSVPRRFRSLLITNEDGPGRLGERLAALCRGRGVTLEPDVIGVSAHYGVWLDEPIWVKRIQDAIRDHQYDVVALDPLRSVTGAVDQGPREFQPFGRACRDLVATTGVTVAWTHHDAKPVVGQPDTRRRGHRASGGGITSAADCPIHAERIGEDPCVILTPAAWKHSSDPPPIEITLQSDVRDGKLWSARMVGRHPNLTSGAELLLAGEIRASLKGSSGMSGSAIARQVKANKQAVLEELARMRSHGEVDSHPTGGRGAPTFWTLAKATAV